MRGIGARTNVNISNARNSVADRMAPPMKKTPWVRDVRSARPISVRHGRMVTNDSPDIKSGASAGRIGKTEGAGRFRPDPSVSDFPGWRLLRLGREHPADRVQI